MSNNKRSRSQDPCPELKDTGYSDTLDACVNALIERRELVKRVLLHDTYSPLIIIFLDTKEVLFNITLVCKYFRWILFESSVGKSLSQKLLWNDYGGFVHRDPCLKSIIKSDNRVEYFRQIYLEFDTILGEKGGMLVIDREFGMLCVFLFMVHDPF
ncbi:MAG: hypothetical protein GY714_14185 [Desulfobacterales bacterium]|nr:hypothetical protein [Desulfobacterales bacterium]